MDISQFYYYHYWKVRQAHSLINVVPILKFEQNPLWGTPAETMEKVSQFYASSSFRRAAPVAGAKEGVTELLKMGYKLVVVTARSESMRGMTEEWLGVHFPGQQQHALSSFW